MTTIKWRPKHRRAVLRAETYDLMKDTLYAPIDLEDIQAIAKNPDDPQCRFVRDVGAEIPDDYISWFEENTPGMTIDLRSIAEQRYVKKAPTAVGFGFGRAQLFEPGAEMVEVEWEFSFNFKTADDAMLFKLTFGGN